ncbi:MAG: hypothetical protein J6332_09750 [Abditibacteriota bacterium]|nr:hypothetical protein [Abditibacteriota bacterium]
MKRTSIIFLSLAAFAVTSAAAFAAPAVKGADLTITAKKSTKRTNKSKPAPKKQDNNYKRPGNKPTPPPIVNRRDPYYNGNVKYGSPAARGRGQKRPKINDNYGPVYRDNRYYYSNKQPYRFGYWNHVSSNGHNSRSAFFYYGVLSYLMVSHTSHSEYEYPSYVQVYDYPEGAGYYLERYPEVGTELRKVFRAIADGWNENNASDITRYVKKKDKIAVMLDGAYEYYVSGEDYIDMVYDAVDSIDTLNFTWYQLKKAKDGSYTGNATHEYYDEYGRVRKVYASYRIKKSGGDYKIIEVGSSEKRL